MAAALRMTALSVPCNRFHNEYAEMQIYCPAVPEGAVASVPALLHVWLKLPPRITPSKNHTWVCSVTHKAIRIVDFTWTLLSRGLGMRSAQSQSVI